MGQDSFTFTVGKLALISHILSPSKQILIGERAHLIEFPSLLLPPGVTSGSIVNIAVHRNVAEEERQKSEFWSLQDEILEMFGISFPEPPKLEVRNVTQTSVTLEWPPLQMATAKLRSLDIYRNGARLASIPAPTQNTSTKLSSLEVNTEYTFQLVLRTTAGTFPSNLLKVRTHTINDTSGICVCFGNVEDEELLESAKESLSRMRAKWSEKIQIDTTHFVCTTPAAVPPPGRAQGYLNNPPGVEYQRALQLSIPVVQPQWVLACDAEKRMVPIANYYLGMTRASLATVSPTASSPASPSSPGGGHATTMSESHTPGTHPYPSQASRTPFGKTPPAPTTLTESDEEEEEQVVSPRTSQGHARSGTMVRGFKFPPVSPTSPASGSNPQSIEGALAQASASKPAVADGETTPTATQGQQSKFARTMSVTAVEVPPPPPVEKTRSSVADDDESEDVGETVEVDLS
ncbi:hypothetical protein BKA62DRAFT_744979 [Auriculariales sp. MPI-PUGE-AT-0066]|nr:hypothetical protein BKA62DRAFT_744979 [Auriculariales sp. MPI-PUGE-AT-0066]